jgi:mobilome CxxCx(11)CxxC protein
MSDAIRQDCWTKAIHSFGTSQIFVNRMASTKNKLRLVAFLGIVVPVAVGGVVTAFGTNFKYLEVVLLVASTVGLFQLILSVWALVAKWEDRLGFAIDSMNENARLAESFKSLGQNPPSLERDLERDYAVLNAHYETRQLLDNRECLTEKEKRFGMRAALRQFQKACAGCKKVPVSLEPTICDVCGNF